MNNLIHLVIVISDEHATNTNINSTNIQKRE